MSFASPPVEGHYTLLTATAFSIASATLAQSSRVGCWHVISKGYSRGGTSPYSRGYAGGPRSPCSKVVCAPVPEFHLREGLSLVDPRLYVAHCLHREGTRGVRRGEPTAD